MFKGSWNDWFMYVMHVPNNKIVVSKRSDMRSKQK